LIKNVVLEHETEKFSHEIVLGSKQDTFVSNIKLPRRLLELCTENKGPSPFSFELSGYERPTLSGFLSPRHGSVGGNSVQIWRVLNKKSRKADKGWSPSLGVERGQQLIKMLHRATS
jgi:hypothetical protein